MSFLARFKKPKPQTDPEPKLSLQPQHRNPSSILPPLKPINLPWIYPYNQFNLADQGWAVATCTKPTDKLHRSSQALITASRAFFSLPTSSKERLRTQHGTEEGWSVVEGEKEFITLRSLDNTPQELKDAASTFWADTGRLLNEILGHIAVSLDLPPEALTAYSKPCMELKPEKTATMLRLFRYEGSADVQPRIVAEAHRDLGLLSFVMSDTPGLEVWDSYPQRWLAVEQNYTQPSGCLLVGRELEKLSNGRYLSGGHLVRSYPSPTAPVRQDSPPKFILSEQAVPKYRYSLVFVLRAHWPVPVNTNDLTTAITGPFREPLNDIVARDLFLAIRNAHFNINIDKGVRDEQKKKLAGKNGLPLAVTDSGTQAEDGTEMVY